MSIWNTIDNINDDRVSPEEGVRYLKVTRWELKEDDPENPVYVLYVTDLDNGAKFSLRYWLAGKSAWSAKATLTKLRDAIFGQFVEPKDEIEGAIVGAEVRINDKGYARVYDFFAAPYELVESHSEMDDQNWAKRTE